MMKLWLNSIGFIVLLSAFLFCSSVFAQEPKVLKVEYEGVSGLWFPSAMGKKILKDVKSLSVVQGKLELLNTKLEVKDERILKYSEALVISEKEKAAVTEGMDACFEQLESVEAEPWYRHPALWVGVGIVVTVILEVAAVATLNALESKD